MQGLIPRGKQLASLGGSFFLAFWPFLFVLSGLFTLVFLVSDFPLVSFRLDLLVLSITICAAQIRPALRNFLPALRNFLPDGSKEIY